MPLVTGYFPMPGCLYKAVANKALVCSVGIAPTNGLLRHQAFGA